MSGPGAAAAETSDVDPKAVAAALAALGPFMVVGLEAAPGGPNGVRLVGATALRAGSDGRLRRLDAGAARGSSGETQGDGWAEFRRELAGRGRSEIRIVHDAERASALLGTIGPTSSSWLDLLELGCILRPELATHDLATLAREITGREPGPDASAIATATLAVLTHLASEIEEGEHDEVREVLVGSRAVWSWGRLFASGGPSDLGPLGRAARRAERRRADSTSPQRSPAADPPASPVDAPDLASLLSEEARFRAEYPAYRVRAEQIELTEAIARAFAEEKAVAVEAGTGIGKTLAYGLVAFLHAASTGERVVVSSANRTLQERVVQEELPAIARVLGVPPLPAVVLKGRANYGNPARARALAREEPEGEADPGLAARLYVASFFARCPHRDLQDFGGWLATRDPSIRSVRDRIACGLDCDLRACRSERGGACAYLARVDALPEAAVVSINHSLLLSWPARYGSIDRLIIDEAHELIGEGDRAFAESLQARDLRGALRRVRTHPKRGLVGPLALRAGRGDLLDRIDGLMARVEEDIEEVGARLWSVVGDQESAVPPGSLLPPSGPWVQVQGAVEGLAASLHALGDAIEEVAPPAPSDDDGERAGDALQREAATLVRAFQNAAGGVLGDLFPQSREDHVYAARAARRRESGHDWSITVTPLDAAELIHDRALEQPKTVVALSATLGVGGDPGPTLAKLGWGSIPRDRRLASLVLASPFDFASQAVLALVRGSTYRERRFEADCAEAIAAVSRLLQGRTLALFTSRRRLQDVARRVAAILADDGISVLVQPASGGAAGLVERFASTPRTVLLGTRSLWQGVDVPGDALSCVLIDKFPFPQPNAPLLRGRQERMRAAGEDAFAALSLEPAVVAFKQMFGRLVRSETDRGFVVVLGADLSKPYVGEFVRSLPGPPRLVVDDVGRVLEEMRSFFDLRVDAAAP